MSAYIGEPPKPKDNGESFYLHSPHDLVYTRITRLFGDAEKPRNGVAADQRHAAERKDDTLTVKVDVHINNNGFVGKPHPSNGHAARSELAREPSEHAYEQICVRQEETGSVNSSSRKKPADNASDSSRSRKTDRRYSRSSSASESSNMSSEIHGLSSTTSTPSLSRHSSNERIGKPGIKTNAEASHERKDLSGVQVESEKEIRVSGNGGPSLSKPPPPPPPPPPDDDVVVVLVNAKPNIDANADRKDARGNGQDGRSESS
ncbi:muscle m-line assembly protein unc-89, partial [Lasius niger]